jgi:5-methylcytosine-specific restriction endonuclease McrA
MKHNNIHNLLKEDVKKGKPAVLRSPHWENVRNKHLKDNPACAACGRTDHVQVHHIKPFHLFPELELEPTNFITLCENDDDGKNTIIENHHLHLGHNGNFKNNNDHVLDDVNKFRIEHSKLGELKGYDMKNLKKIISG